MMHAKACPYDSTFLMLALRLHPGLDGVVDDPGGVGLGPDGDNVPVIRSILEYWNRGFPEAGQPYAAVRTWTLMVWQPVFLAILGVHGTGGVAPVERLWQRVDQGVVAGFRLPDDWNPKVTGEHERIREASLRLQMVRDRLLSDLRQVTRIKPLTANRLMADTLLVALRRLGELLPGFDNHRIRTLGNVWLEAAGLRDQSRYLVLETGPGRSVLGLERRACCMHYRRADGDYCSSCPLLDHTERERRQLEELSHEAVAV